MQRLLKFTALTMMILAIAGFMAPNALLAVNKIRLDCPVEKPTPGDSVGIKVYITNDVTIGGFSLGFKYNSNDIEITSVQQGPVFPPPPAFGSFLTQFKPADNMVLTGWLNFTPTFPIPVNSTEAHLMTLWVRVPLGTPAQCVSIDSTFVPPAGFWQLSPAAGGTIEPEYADCGAADLSIAGGCAGPSNTAPIVSDIPNQTIAEGATFAAITLDNFVADAEDADASISWVASSANPNSFSVAIVNRVATVSYPGGEFAGSATFSFIATDPGGLSDTDQAVFTVTAVNDPPVIADIPDQTVPYGSDFVTIALDNYVSDPDNSDNQMTWTHSGSVDLIVTIDVNRVATITKPSPTWFGTEGVTFKATDPGSLFDEEIANFTVQSPTGTIVLSKDTLFFNGYQNGPNPAGKPVIITNGGTGALNWTATEAMTWLTVAPAAGVAGESFTASVDISTLPIGRTTADITVSSPEATNSPKTVVVVVDIVDDVDIKLTPDALTFTTLVNENPAPKSVLIENGSPSGIEFNWGALETTPWLGINPSNGTSPANMEVSIDASGLLPGTYEAKIIIKQLSKLATEVNDDQDTVSVSLTVDTPTDVDDIGGILPTAFTLDQNFPNPFNPTTTIEFDLPKASYVTLSVYNVLGQKVTDLVNTTLGAGRKRVEWDGTDGAGRTVESGVYFYRISADGFSMTRKMMLLK